MRALIYDGCIADFCVLSNENLLKIPEGVSDERAVFIEPLAAACEILEQIDPQGNEKTAVLGDGRLVTKTFSLENALNALEKAEDPESLKILIDTGT